MDTVKGRSVRSGGNVLTTLSCSASGIFVICCDLTRPTITRRARTFQSTRTRRRRVQYIPLVAFCLRHFLADFIICMCEFDFRQAQVSAGPQHWPSLKNAPRLGIRPAKSDCPGGLDAEIDEGTNLRWRVRARRMEGEEREALAMPVREEVDQLSAQRLSACLKGANSGSPYIL